MLDSNDQEGLCCLDEARAAGEEFWSGTSKRVSRCICPFWHVSRGTFTFGVYYNPAIGFVSGTIGPYAAFFSQRHVDYFPLSR